MEENIFFGTGLTCFVSDLDIVSGTDWWNKIKKELKSSSIGIVCITKENLSAPWLYYESGAMIARGITVIPLLINCSNESLNGTPLTKNQSIDFYNLPQFIKMIKDIDRILGLGKINNQIDEKLKEYYEQIKKDLSNTLKLLKDLRIFNIEYTYPRNIKFLNVDTIYISVPMASISETEYEELRKNLFLLKDILNKIGFKEIICPMLTIDNKSNFDGQTRAIKTNFTNMKKVDSMIVIYPRKLPSSVLVELGYGLALCKRMVIFYGEELPYIVEKAGENIEHIKTYKYNKLIQINQIVKSDGMALFEVDEDKTRSD